MLEKSLAAQREACEAYEALVDHSSQALLILQDGRIVFANAAVRTITGYSQDEVLQATESMIETAVHPEDRALVWERHRSRLAGQSPPTNYEFRILHKDGHARWVEIHTGPVSYRGRPAIQASLADVTGRVAGRERLRESEQRYRAIFENAVLGIYRTTPDGRVLAANPTLVRMLGYERFEDLAQRNPQTEGFERGFARSEFLERIEADGQVTGLESAWTRSDGTVLYVRENACAARDESGRTLYYEGTVEDITERREIEQAVRESEERFDLFMQHLPAAIAVKDADGQVVYANRGFAEAANCTPEDLIGKTTDELVPPELQAQYREENRRALTGQTVSSETSFPGLDGPHFWMTYKFPIPRDGQPALLGLASFDVTDRRRAEEALRENERQKNLVLNATREMFAYHDTDLRIQWANRASGASVGVPADELVGRHCYEVWHGRTSPCEDCPVLKAKATGEAQEAEVSTPDGRLWHLRGYPVFGGDGQVVALVEFGQDITARKRAEQKLRQSEEQFRAVFDNASAMVAMADLDGRWTHVNRYMAEAFGYSEVELTRMRAQELTHPGDRPVAADLLGKLLAGEIDHYRMTRRHIRKDGRLIWVDLAVSPLRNERGEIEALIGVGTDTTAARNAEEELRRSQLFLRTVMDAYPGNVAVLDHEGRIVMVNEPWIAFGLSQGLDPQYQHEGVDYVQICRAATGQDREIACQVADGIEGVLAGAAKAFDIEYPCETPEAGLWFRLQVSPFRYEEKMWAVVAHHDITERRQAVQALERSEQKFRAIADYTYDLELWVNSDGRLLWMNPTIERFTGYTVEECKAMADFPAQLIHPEDRSRILELYRQACAGSSGNDVELRLIHRSGDVTWMSASWQPIGTGDGTTLGWRASLRDITDRVRAERELRQSEARIRSIFRAAPIGIGVVIDRKIANVNASFCAMTGYARDELIERNARFLYPTEEDYEYVGWEKYRQIEERGTGSVETRFRRKDGRTIDVLLSSSPLNPLDRSAGVTFTALDITERKEAERALRISQRKLAAVFDSAPVMMIVVDKDRRVCNANRACLEATGHSAAEVEGFRGGHVLRCVHSLDHPDGCGFGEFCRDCTIRQVTATTLRTGEAFRDVEAVLPIRMNGDIRERIFRVSTVRVDAAHQVLTLICMEDITERKRSAEALREQHSLMDYIIRHDPNAVAVYDNDLRYVFVSERYLRDYGLGDSNVIGRHHYEVFPEMPERWKEVHRRALGGAIERNDDDWFERPDGSITYNRWECRPWYQADGRIGGIITYTEVTTERKRAEARLRESEERYRTIFQNSPVGVFRSTLEGRFLEVNRVLAELLGYDSPEAVIREIYDIGKQIYIDRQQREKLLADHLQSADVARYQNRYRRKDGSEFIANLYLKTVRDAEGKPLFLDGIVEDVTDRRRAEQALQEKHANLLGVIESTGDLIASRDRNGRLVYYNSAFAGMVRRLFDVEARPGLRTQDYLPAAERERWEGILERVTAGEPYCTEFEWSHADGARRWYEISFHPIRSGSETLGTVEFTRDITERKQAEETLRYERDRSQNYLDTVEAVIVALDTEGRITLINRKGCRTLGWSEEELRGRHWFAECLPQPEGMETVYPAFQRLIEGEFDPLEYFENPVINRIGEVRQIAWHNALLRDAEGGIIGTLSAGEDITERRRAEDALQESERVHRTLVEGLPDIVMRFDREVRHLFVSDNVAEVTGIPAERFIGKTHRELGFDEEICRYWEDSIRQVCETGLLHEQEFSFEGRQGTTVFNWRLVPETDDEGRVQSVLSISRDVTQRRRHEEALAASERRFRETLERVQLGAVEVDAEGRIAFINHFLLQLTGWKEAEVLGLDWFDVFVPEEEREELRAVHAANLSGHGEFLVHENPILTRDGRQRSIRWTNTVHYDKDGNIVGVVGLGEDVTERERAERELRESEERFRTMFDGHSAVMLLIEPQTGAVVDANVAATRFYGYTHEQLRSLCIGDINQLPPEQVAAERAAAAAEERNYFVFPHRLAGGEIRWVEVYSTPVQIRDQRLLFSIIHDVTDQKEAERRAKEREAELLHVSRLSTLGEMASGFAHELNQPLSAILSFANASVRSIESAAADMDRLRANLERIASQSVRAGEIIRRIRAFAQRRQQSLGPVCVNDTIRDVLGLMHYETRHTQVDVVLELAPALPPIWADAIQIEQVLLNLIRNAIEAMQGVPEDRRQLTLRTERGPDETVQVTVADTGPGIAPEDLPNIFDPFFTTKDDGLGIGLSITRSIVELHGGRISAEPRPTGGCAFTFTISIAPPDRDCTAREKEHE